MPVMYSCYDRCVICQVCFYWVLPRISGFMITTMLATHTLLHQSPVLILSYHEYFLFDIYLLIHASAHDTVFNAWLWFGFIDTRVLSLHAIWLSYHHSPGEFYLTPLDSHVQVLELGACRSLESVDSPSCWSEWRSWSMDPQQTVWSSILPGPLCASRVFLL